MFLDAVKSCMCLKQFLEVRGLYSELETAYKKAVINHIRVEISYCNDDEYKKIHSNILGIVDKNTNLQGTNIGAYEIFAPEKLAELKPDVVICSIKNNNEYIYLIVKEFMEENYPNIKLVENIFEW